MVRRLTGAGATVDASKPTRVLLRLPVDSLRSNGAAEGQREVDLTNADHCGQLPCAKLRNTATPKVPVQGPGISEPAMWLVCNLPNKSPISSSYACGSSRLDVALALTCSIKQVSKEVRMSQLGAILDRHNYPGRFSLHADDQAGPNAGVDHMQSFSPPHNLANYAVRSPGLSRAAVNGTRPRISEFDKHEQPWALIRCFGVGNETRVLFMQCNAGCPCVLP